MSAPRRWLVLSVAAQASGTGAPAGAGPPADREGGDTPPAGGPRSPAEVAADLADALLALGGRAVEERDGRLLTQVPEPDVPEAFLREARRVLAAAAGGAVPDLETSWQEQRDWESLWRQGLAPRRISPRLLVTPSWCEPDARPGDLVLTLDPGVAFGTAEHGTTRGCLRLLDAAVTPGERVFDVGAGSGVLSIAAVLLGAREVRAWEGDPMAAGAARENARLNGVADRVSVVEAWAAPADLAGAGPADGVVANIESGPLTRLLPGFAAALRPGGWLVLSGLTAEEWPGFRERVARAGFRPGATDADGEWRSGRFTRER